jgi:hypothetical protein
MKAATEPQRPAFAVPPDMVSPGGELHLWFTDPPGALAQMLEPRVGTAAMARWLVTEARQALYARFPDSKRFIFVLDLSPMTSRDPAVRAIIGDAGKEMKDEVSRCVFIPAANGGAMYLKSLEIAVLLLRGFGVKIELGKSLPQAVSSLRLGYAPQPYSVNTPRRRY